MSVGTEEKTFCAVHPDRETALRCNKCDRLMCVQCAVRTPIGYRCRECARQHESRFFNASSNDYLVVAGVCGVAGLLLGGLMGALQLGFVLFALILGLPVGGAIAELALRSTQRRRGRYSGEVGGVATFVGGLTGAFGSIYLNYMQQYNQLVDQFGERVVAQNFPPLSLDYFLSGANVGLLIFVGLAAVAVYGRYRMKM